MPTLTIDKIVEILRDASENWNREAQESKEKSNVNRDDHLFFSGASQAAGKLADEIERVMTNLGGRCAGEKTSDESSGEQGKEYRRCEGATKESGPSPGGEDN